MKITILISGIVFTLAGILIHYIWKFYNSPLYGGISKERVTPSFVSLTLGSGAILFWLIWYLFDKKQITKGKSIILRPIGKNALFLYILQPLFILFASLYLPQNSHAVLVMFVSVLNLVVVWLIARWMDKKKVYVVI